MKKRATWCHLLFYFTFYVLNMFRTLIYRSSVACDYSVELPHWLYCSWFDVCWSFGVVGLEWYPGCRLKHSTTNVLSQQNSRKLLMMDILMSETCWAHKKWNKIVTSGWSFILQQMERWLAVMHCNCSYPCHNILGIWRFDYFYSKSNYHLSNRYCSLLASKQTAVSDKCLLLYVQSWTHDGRKYRPKHADCDSKIK